MRYRTVVHAPAVGVSKVPLAAFTAHLPLNVRRAGWGRGVSVIEYSIRSCFSSPRVFSRSCPPAIVVRDIPVCVDGSLALWFGWTGEDESVASGTGRLEMTSLHDGGCYDARSSLPSVFVALCVFFFLLFSYSHSSTPRQEAESSPVPF